jgi:hypothetical protein
LIKQNFKEIFSVIRIWPFNPMAMDDKTLPLNIYITTNNNESNKEDSTSTNKVGSNQQWGGVGGGQKFVDTKLLNIIIIVYYGTSNGTPKCGNSF